MRGHDKPSKEMYCWPISHLHLDYSPVHDEPLPLRRLQLIFQSDADPVLGLWDLLFVHAQFRNMLDLTRLVDFYPFEGSRLSSFTCGSLHLSSPQEICMMTSPAGQPREQPLPAYTEPSL